MVIKDHRRNKVPDFYIKYKNLRNKVQRMVDEAKKSDFRTKAEE